MFFLHRIREVVLLPFRRPTSSTVLGTSVKFLPTHATVSLVPSQLQTLGHLPARAGRARENSSRQDTAEAKIICVREAGGENTVRVTALQVLLRVFTGLSCVYISEHLERPRQGSVAEVVH